MSAPVPEVPYGTLVDLAAKAGLDAIGATTAEPFEPLRDHLTEYNQRGRTGYEWADIEARIDPQEWLPEAKSLICAALSYLTPMSRAMAMSHPRSSLHGSVSVYSYGEDYHRVLERRLRELHRLLEKTLGRPVTARIALDTSPLVDRAVAERAGIGWIGKNCMLFTPEHGSFVFIGTLLVDAVIEGPATKPQSPCHTCTKCIDACPTGALLGPGVIDATHCLSYVTQMKGIVPERFRRPLGRRVWGCDTCQWACPENRGASTSENTEFQPHGELAFPDLLALLSMSNREFNRRYGKSAAAWRGLPTLKRNALIALGNCKDVQAVGAIIPYLTHSRKELRASAAWALSQLRTKEAVSAVREAAMQESDEDVLQEMQWAL